MAKKIPVLWLRWIIVLTLLASLTGCFYWLRAYQTYLQMGDFDQNFAITSDNEFSVHFKDPILYSSDFISLAKLQASQISPLESGQKWRYWFVKVNDQNQIIQPEIKFYFDLAFNQDDRITRWSFSPLFLHIAPPQFLEVSFRSLGSAEINQDKKQLKANPDLLQKINADLPKKDRVVAQLGDPLSIQDKPEQEVYRYHFLLQTNGIEEGYEKRALTTLKLSFDKTSHDLIKMSGSFAGLKISIDYRDYLNNPPHHS